MNKPSLVFCAIIFAFLLFTTLKTSAQISHKIVNQKQNADNAVVKRLLTYIIFEDMQGGFGYNILDQKRIIIHQPSVPGLQGNNGFACKQDAAKVALLVLRKIHKNIMPPTVTRQELTSLNTNNY